MEFREMLLESEKQKVLKDYEGGKSIEEIRRSLSGNVAQKAVREVVAGKHAMELECVRCGRTKHVAHLIDERFSCIECGRVHESQLIKH